MCDRILCSYTLCARMCYHADMEPESLLERSLVEQWREFVARKTRVWNALELELDRRHGLSASEFEVLDKLSEYDCATKPPRVQELASHVPITQSALSRMIGRLESQNLVTRALCVDDRRGVYVVLTAEGIAKLAEARPTHRAVLAAEFGTPEASGTATAEAELAARA